jgi:hypothetical protein
MAGEFGGAEEERTGRGIEGEGFGKRGEDGQDGADGKDRT